MKKYKKILLTETNQKLNNLIQYKISKNEAFLDNFIDYGSTPNQPIKTKGSWHNLSYLILKEDCDLRNIKEEDILIFVDFTLNRPSTNVSNIAIISFCNDINFVQQIASDLVENLYNEYGTEIINFTGVEGGTTYKLFNKINDNLAELLFPNWYGRYIGYKTDSFINKKLEKKNLHYFEIIRK